MTVRTIPQELRRVRMLLALLARLGGDPEWIAEYRARLAHQEDRYAMLSRRARKIADQIVEEA